MTEQSQLDEILSDVRRRLTRRAVWRAWAFGAAVLTTVVLAGLGAILLVAREGVPLVFTVSLVAVLALVVVGRTFWPLRHPISDLQIARFIDERVEGLDDILVTAVDYGRRQDASPVIADVLVADAAAAMHDIDLNQVVSRDSMRQAALRAVAASVALLAALTFFAPFAARATSIAVAYLLPARLALEVSPGSIKVRAGEPLTITARVIGVNEGLVPLLRVAVGDQAREVLMTPTSERGTYGATIPAVTASFAYTVAAANARSDEYAVTVIRPARVERIDIHYEFPRGLGLESRTDEDSGDIYGPAGTKVRLSITVDKPIASGALTLNDGRRISLAAQGQVVEGLLTIDDDGSYRVALADIDGLESVGDTEYFIRTLDDWPPDVRIVRPASDRQVTPVEEVLIEARADDDYGIASLDLVLQTAAGAQRTVPLSGANGSLTASALHTLFLEDLKVQPGDFVTYYARARDVARGRRATEARSDIFFLEVKPFEEEFVAAQSQMMGQGGGGNQRSMSGLAEAQKEIIVATWKLDARSRRARDARSTADIKAIAEAQKELKNRAEQASGQATRGAMDPRRRRGGTQGRVADDPIARAVEAMGHAAGELEKLSTAGALPHEMEALNQLLKAEADIQRRQVARQQQAGGGGGQNRPEADLSSLFDRELRRRQETNYETPTTTEQREETRQDDPLEKIRDLARRQDQLNRQQRDLARQREQLGEAELKRQLERLTREQNELRRQAEQLAQRMQQQGSKPQQSQSPSQSSPSSQASPTEPRNSGASGANGQQDSKRMRAISEEMRNAATNLGRQNPNQASENGNRAAEQLRELERQMQASRPDDRRRALGDLQLETRQLADAQRRLANEASQTAQGQSGEDARRRLAGEQERLAERTERLQENVRRLSRGAQGDADQRRATEEAARELDRQKLANRMRESANSLRQPGERSEGDQVTVSAQADGAKQAARQGEDVARVLDKIADRLGAAAGAQDADSRRLSHQLSRSQELRQRIAEAEKSIEQLQREARDREPTDKQAADDRAQGQQQATSQGPQRGGQSASQQGQNGQPGAQGGAGASGAHGGADGGQSGSIERLQREVNERMREAERLAEEVRRENPGMTGPSTPESWFRSTSAPGTEAFKQDFARWESLKQNLLVALEQVESKISDQLRTSENQERLNAGGHEAVSDAYRALVDKYYRSLAAPRRPPDK